MLCTEWVVLVATLWAAFSLGIIYLFTRSVEQVNGEFYVCGAVQAGFVQAGVVISEIIGCGLCVSTNRWYYASVALPLIPRTEVALVDHAVLPVELKHFAAIRAHKTELSLTTTYSPVAGKPRNDSAVSEGFEVCVGRRFEMPKVRHASPVSNNVGKGLATRAPEPSAPLSSLPMSQSVMQ